MKFVHGLSVPLRAEDARAAFRDLEMLASCLPGASLDTVEEQVATGRVKIKVGPIALTYRGEVREVEGTEASTLRFVADAKEIKGLGEANATIRIDFTPAGSSTDVKVTTDLSISGRLTQFGGGVIADVADQIFAEFVTNLRQRIGGVRAGAAADSGQQGVSSPQGAPAPEASIDALSYLAQPVRERMPAVLATVAAVVLLRWLWATRARRNP